MGNTGDRFARWFVALPPVEKYVMSVILATTVLVAPALLLTPLHVGSRPTSNQFKFTCVDNRQGDHQVSVELPSDPTDIDRVNEHPEELVALFRKACPTY